MSNHFNESFNIIFMETIKAIKKLIFFFFFYKNILKIFSKLMLVSVDFSLIILLLGSIAWEEKNINKFYIYYLAIFFFLRESFKLWCSLLIIAIYHQTKTPISFWYRRRLNPRSLIQPSETLTIELTGTYYYLAT